MYFVIKLNNFIQSLPLTTIISIFIFFICAKFIKEGVKLALKIILILFLVNFVLTAVLGVVLPDIFNILHI